MTILIDGQSFHVVDAHHPRVNVHRGDEHPRHSGDQILTCALHLIDLVGGVVQHTLQLAQLLSGGVVQHRAALQLHVEVFALRQFHVLGVDGHALALQGQRRVHVLHPRQRQQQHGFVNAGGAHLRLLSAAVEAVKFRQKFRIEAYGVQLHLAPDAVCVDDGANMDEFLFHMVKAPEIVFGGRRGVVTPPCDR